MRKAQWSVSVPWQCSGSSFLRSEPWLSLELGNKNIPRPSLFQSRIWVRGCGLAFSFSLWVFFGVFCFSLSRGEMGALAARFSSCRSSKIHDYIVAFGKGCIHRAFKWAFFWDGMKIFSHSEGNNADLSKFPVPAELSLPGTRYRMEKSFICKNWVLKLGSAFLFFF